MSFNLVDDSNKNEAIRILAEAFHDDPVLNWSLNNPQKLEPFFEFILPVYIKHQLTYLDAQGRGAACWLGPDQKIKWPLNFASISKVVKVGGAKGIWRMLMSGMKIEKNHPSAPHYYLFLIGVSPASKGQGIGTSLISHVLKMCDDQGVAAYLENSKEENLPFYEGHGFKVQKQIRFTASAPPVWLMWREPAGSEK